MPREEIDTTFTFGGDEDLICSYYGYSYYAPMTFSGCQEYFDYIEYEWYPSANGQLIEPGRLEGEYEGRCIFDNMVFNDNDSLRRRVKHICSSLGLDASDKVDLQPSAFKGRKCHVTVEVKDYIGKDGAEKRSNEVLFKGYEPAKEGEAEQNSKDLPF